MREALSEVLTGFRNKKALLLGEDVLSPAEER